MTIQNKDPEIFGLLRLRMTTARQLFEISIYGLDEAEAYKAEIKPRHVGDRSTGPPSLCDY